MSSTLSAWLELCVAPTLPASPPYPGRKPRTALPSPTLNLFPSVQHHATMTAAASLKGHLIKAYKQRLLAARSGQV